VLADACAALRDRGEPVEDEPCDEPPPVSITARRILELSASGLGVNEVAQRLFLTPGTVRAALEQAQVGVQA
jgi:DNA-binding NarL/FixJ family response regulator